MEEEWRDIAGFDGAYQVSDLGRVRRSPFAPKRSSAVPGNVLTSRLNAHGYLSIVLYDRLNKKMRNIGVHTLVLEAFVGPRPDGMEASHMNGIRTDAKLINLRWETRSENHARKRGHGTMMRGARHYATKLTDENVIEMRRQAKNGERHGKIAQQFGLCRRNVSRIVSGEAWAHVAFP